MEKIGGNSKRIRLKKNMRKKETNVKKKATGK